MNRWETFQRMASRVVLRFARPRGRPELMSSVFQGMASLVDVHYADVVPFGRSLSGIDGRPSSHQRSSSVFRAESSSVNIISTNQIYFLNKILIFFYPISNPKNALSFLIQFWSLKVILNLWTNFEFSNLWNYYFTLYALKFKKVKLMVYKMGCQQTSSLKLKV